MCAGVRGRVRVACARAVQALTHGGHVSASAELAACATLDDVQLVARELADSIPETKISLTIADDGAFSALTGAPPTSAYIAAHAAMRLDGAEGYAAEGYAAERAWQSRWLVGRRELRADSWRSA